MSSPGQWGSFAPSGHSGTQVPYIMLPLQSRRGIVITCVVEAGLLLVPTSGKETKHRGGIPDALRSDPEVVWVCLLTFRWQEFSHMATPTCKGAWEV